MFFENLGIKWWYEPEGYPLRFDYEEFVDLFWAGLSEDQLLQQGIPQTFKRLDGKEYWYLPDFYLPELNYWIEVKGPAPKKEAIQKAFMLSQLALNASKKKRAGAKTDAEEISAIKEFIQRGVYIIYGDIPWPYPPHRGKICGWRGFDSGSGLFRLLRAAKGGAEELAKEHEYRDLLKGSLNLGWQECPLCQKIGIGKIGEPFCSSCHDKVAVHLMNHLARYPVLSEAPDPPRSIQALGLSKDLMNPEFFASGHKSPRLREAYRAARSAKF